MNDTTDELISDVDSGLSRVELVYRKIKKNILSNAYPPGYQALEPELAARLGVSRTPVREALIRLESEKLIELIPRRGMRVIPLVREDVIEMMQILSALESLAVDLISQRELTDCSRFTECVDRMMQTMANNALDEWLEAEQEFYRLLMLHSGSSRLSQIAFSLRDQMARARRLMLNRDPEQVKSSSENYRMVVSAIAQADWVSAKSFLSKQILTMNYGLAGIFSRKQRRPL